MYLTIKQRKETTRTTSNNIDELFTKDVFKDNVDTPIVSDFKQPCRFKTFNTDEPNQHISPTKLATFCEYINNIARSHPHPEREYTHFEIPKKTHGMRPIDAPTDELKQDLKKIANALTEFLDICPHDAAWAYVKNRSVVGAIKEHTDNRSRWYLKLDLHNFFGSCTKEFTVNSLLEIYPFATNIEMCRPTLETLFDLGSLNGALPQGTPLSPTLTNLIMVKYDYIIRKTLTQLGKEGTITKQRYVYTRYADDIIISAQTDFDFNTIIECIETIFQNTPLEINKEKTRYGSTGGRNWNLGIMCNENLDVSIGHKRKNNLRAWIHNYISSLHNDISWDLKELQKLQGNLSWLHQVHPEKYEALMNYVNKKYEQDVYATLLNDIKEKQSIKLFFNN